MNLHVPRAPCLSQTPRALARVVQPSSLHTFLLPPPCFQHRPLFWTAVVHLLTEQNPSAPCLPQSPRASAMVLQPSTEHATVLLSCFVHFPLIEMALLMHASVVQYPKAPCLKQTNLPGLCGVSQSGSAQDSFTVCLKHKRPFFRAAVVQPSRRHSPMPCFLHKPRTCALAEQPSIEQGFLP